MTVSASRVKETSTGTGTGDLTLAGAATGHRTFNAALTVGPGFPYVIALGSQWEVGTGHLSDATTLVRDTVLASSNAGALVSFSAGVKEVFCSLAGEQITAVGYDFLAAVNAAAQRTVLGLGTAATAAAGDFDAAGSAAAAQAAAIAASQPVDADLTAIAALSTTAHGRGLLTGADAAASRTTLGLGTLATQSGTYGNVTASDAASDTTTWPLLAGSQTGDQQPRTDADFTYDSATNTVTFGNITGSALAMTIQPRAPTVLENAGTLSFVCRNAVKANSDGGGISFTTGNPSGTGLPGAINFFSGGSTFTLQGNIVGISAAGGNGFSFDAGYFTFLAGQATAAIGDNPSLFVAGTNIASTGNNPIQFETDGGPIIEIAESTFGTQQLGLFGNTPVARPTYGAPTGTATRTTFATNTVTLEQLAQRVKAMIDDARSRGDYA